MTAHKCNCGLPAPHTTLCARCTYRLERDLAEIPSIVEQLDLTLSRQDRMGAQGKAEDEDQTCEACTGQGRTDAGRCFLCNGSGKLPVTAKVQPLGYNANASEVRANLHGTLVGWVRDIHIEGEHYPADVTQELSRWLLSRMHDISVHPAADQMYDEISYAANEARKAVDRPRNRSRVFVGACLEVSCPGELWAHIPTADFVYADPTTHASIDCTECEATYAAEQWSRLGARLRRAS